jgi:hypothetical protein
MAAGRLFKGGQEPIRPGEPSTYWAVGITFPAPN